MDREQITLDYEVCMNTELFDRLTVENALEQVGELLSDLHKSEVVLSVKDFTDSADTNWLFLLDKDAGQIMSVMQFSLARTPPKSHVYINNVVTHSDYRRNGLGTVLLNESFRAMVRLWGTGLGVELTNSPKKDNAGFYEALGFTSRAHDSDNPTVVWVMDI
ncbi:GNAT family N-acetyltransferase [Candidatus Kaiserbacteria bacterium]|nr:GNAT family N-acetyltransferase [Candidatus Kaiserbacteria bacterium]